MPSPRTTRLAPSPTGALHLGNARTFAVNWALARRCGWRIVLRIEDLDGPRIKPGAAGAAIDTLRWLGLDWDEGPIVQSADLGPYRAAMERLAARAQAYPCELTRAQVASAASAPQEGAGEILFPVEHRPPLRARVFDAPGSNWRFATPPGAVEFLDGFCGPQRHDPSATVGDFVVWTARGQPAYQLAVVVDDHRHGVTHIVRGDDLLDSAARQILLRGALGLGPEPAYIHLPLVRGGDGRRLAKRHGDTRLDAYRARGVGVERIVGLLGWWCGVPWPRRAMSATEFLTSFDLSRIPREPIVFAEEDDRWLLSGS